jgi:peptidoglycan/LPS O-acetylase OafA/YrhL
MEQPPKKLNTVLFFDGIAILCIVFYHEIIRYPQNPLFWLSPYFVTIGLSLFTFSSGYKLILNHVEDINRRDFLGKYYLTRFVRLYKPYIGYTVLIVVPLVVITYLAIHIIHLDFPDGTIFTRLIASADISGILNFLGGVNPIADQLWYLVALLVITSVCFTILYFLNTRCLFLAFIPLFIVSVFIELGAPQGINILNFFTYAPFFIVGCFWAYKRQWSQGTHYYLAVLFLILIVLSILLRPGQLVLIYLSCFFFPMFLLLFFDSVNKIPLAFPFLIFSGTYSFQIYLFHQPLILHIISTGLINVLKIDFLVMPIIVTILTIYCCVGVYKFIKLLHLNIIFE